MSTRRTFLKAATGSSAYLAMAGGLPNCWLKAANLAEASQDERTLVVIQLSGGNDGINTLIPFGDDEYYRNRFTLAIDPSQIHQLDEYVGLHPSLGDLAELTNEGQGAIVQGVGYDNPNRSHFESMDLWHTAHLATSQISTGWLGRFLDAQPKQDDVAALHIGNEDQPLALAAQSVQVPTVGSLEGFRLAARDDNGIRQQIEATLEHHRAPDPLLDHIAASTRAALTTSQQVEDALGDYETNVDYPQTNLSRKLRNIAQLIHAGLKTRVYYVTLDGFDTHSNQLEAHAGLLSELNGAVAAFVNDLSNQGSLERVTTLVFSEFGRRVKENASRGTDHGAAAPLMLFGGTVQGGLHGVYPSMTDLGDGDLKYTVDYRTIYAALIQDWFGANRQDIVGSEFDAMPNLIG